MIKKILSSVLMLLVTAVLANPGFAQQHSQTPPDKHTQKIRKYVKSLRRWDVGDPVTVELYDGSKIKGHISQWPASMCAVRVVATD